MVIFLHIKGVNLRGESCESSKILGLQKGGYTIYYSEQIVINNVGLSCKVKFRIWQYLNTPNNIFSAL